MRKNEYTSLEEFTSQYVGEWGPSDGHWFGLDFEYKGEEYRLHTWNMYANEKDALFGLHHRKKEAGKSEHQYELLGKYDSIEELLESRVIGSRPFREVIMDDDTVLLGQD